MFNFQPNFPYPNQLSPSSIEIPRVNGQSAAQSYQMPPNSSILLLDENSPIVYLVRTDSACYKRITPYSITEYKEEPTVDSRTLLNRIEAIERRLDESYTSTATRADNVAPTRSSQILDEYSQSVKQSASGNSKRDC